MVMKISLILMSIVESLVKIVKLCAPPTYLITRLTDLGPLGFRRKFYWRSKLGPAILRGSAISMTFINDLAPRAQWKHLLIAFNVTARYESVKSVRYCSNWN